MNAELVFAANSRRKAIVLRKIISASVDSSYLSLSDKAEITLPRNVRVWNNSTLPDQIKTGDELTLSFGYDGELYSLFSGYVTEIGAGIPIVLKCEDGIYALKKIPVHKSYSSVSLATLLGDIQDLYPVDALNVQLGQLRFPNTTAAKVLEFLKKEYGLYCFLKNGILTAGNIYNEDATAMLFHLEKNVKRNDLKYKSNSDNTVSVKATGVTAKGSKISVTVGDSGGDVINVSFFGIDSTAELTKLAYETLAKYRREGYTGNFATIGHPWMGHGEKAEIQSSLYPERDGIYYISGVKYEYSSSPYFEQIITLSEHV